MFYECPVCGNIVDYWSWSYRYHICLDCLDQIVRPKLPFDNMDKTGG